MEALVCKKLGVPTVPLNSPEDSPFTFTTTYPIPELHSPTSVRVRIKATSLNFGNYLQIQGKYQEKAALPFILGSDYSGVVDSVGSKVTKFRVGDPVCSETPLGSFAEFIVADETELFRVPDGCDLVASGAIPIAYGTSHVALVQRAKLRPNHVLMVLGAAGGVGLAAVQIGKASGATVIAVARGDEKIQFLKSLGTDHVIDLNKGNVTDSVKGFLKARKLKGVDVLYDPVGGKLTKESLKLLNWGANILIIGFASGEVPVIPSNIALVKNWTIHGFYLGNFRKTQPAAFEDSIKELLSWLSNGLISVNISHIFNLSEAHLAFSALKDRKAIGKIIIVFNDEQVRRSNLKRAKTSLKGDKQVGRSSLSTSG